MSDALQRMKESQVGHTGGDATLVRVLAPRHQEQFSLRESGFFQPWQVKLLVQKDPIDPRLHETYYYVRGRDPGHASTLAYSMWTKWEKVERGLEWSRWPDLASAECLVMDEKEWSEAWRRASRMEHKRTGMPDNPSCFTVVVDE
jgi:hypothetical protein